LLSLFVEILFNIYKPRALRNFNSTRQCWRRCNVWTFHSSRPAVLGCQSVTN